MWLKLLLVFWGVKKKKTAAYEILFFFFAQIILFGNKIKFSDGIRYLKKVNDPQDMAPLSFHTTAV